MSAIHPNISAPPLLGGVLGLDGMGVVVRPDRREMADLERALVRSRLKLRVNITRDQPPIRSPVPVDKSPERRTSGGQAVIKVAEKS
jgi:hypothetical protein